MARRTQRTNLDGKFHGVVIKNKDGTLVPPDQWMILLAKDNAVPETLDFYRQKCAEFGASEDQLEAIDALIGRVATWRAANPDRCKVADVEPDELII